MIILEMYLDGQLLDTTKPCRFLLQNKYKEHLKSLINELEKDHADLLQKSDSKPAYLLSGVTSCMNHFVPLRHPQNSHLSCAPIERPAPANIEVSQSPKKHKLHAVDNLVYKQLNSSKANEVA